MSRPAAGLRFEWDSETVVCLYSSDKCSFRDDGFHRGEQVSFGLRFHNIAPRA
jgi:hypothetical protein